MKLQQLLRYLFVACALSPTARASPTPKLDQQKINSVAAAFLRIRLSLVDAVGRRRPDEPPKVYFDRLFTPDHETDAAVGARIQGYLKTVAIAVGETASIRAGIIPVDRRQENVTLWRRASRDAAALETLYRRAVVTKAAAANDKAAVLLNATRAGGAAGSLKRRPQALADLFSQILHTAQDGYDALRDVNP